MGRRKDDGEYRSNSSIDNPPYDEPRKPRQLSAVKKNEDEDADPDPGECMVEIDLQLSVKRNGGKAYKIPVIATATRGSLVKEKIDLALKGEQFNQVLSSVLSLPEKHKQKSTQKDIF